MIVYLSRPMGMSTNLARQLTWVAKLYRAQFLTDTSTVWINTNIEVPLFIVNAARPAAVWWHEAPTAGFLRLNNGRARWGRTYRATTRNSALDIDTSKIRLLTDRAVPVTVVVDHLYSPEDGPGLGVVDGADTYTPVDGYYSNGEFAVVDLPYYRVPPNEPTPAASDYAGTLATFQGTRLLEWGMSPQQRAALRDNPDSARVELPPELLTRLVGALDVFPAVAHTLDDILNDKLIELPG